jgi:hypothetical protein
MIAATPAPHSQPGNQGMDIYLIPITLTKYPGNVVVFFAASSKG